MGFIFLAARSCDSWEPGMGFGAYAELLTAPTGTAKGEDVEEEGGALEEDEDNLAPGF